MNAHRDASILDALNELIWEAVELHHSIGMDLQPIKVYIVHECGASKQIQQVVKNLRGRDITHEYTFTNYSVFYMRPLGFGITDVDLSGEPI